MESTLDVAKKLKWWITAIVSVGGIGFALAMVLGSLARADDLIKLGQRVTATEVNRQDDAKRLDWLVNEVEKIGWSMHTAPTSPPARRSMQDLDQSQQ